MCMYLQVVTKSINEQKKNYFQATVESFKFHVCKGMLIEILDYGLPIISTKTDSQHALIIRQYIVLLSVLIIS